MPHSAVTRIELNKDNTISILISIDGFEKGTPIELYGQVFQDNGAVGTFYSVQEFPEDEGKTAVMEVPPISAADKKVFVAQFPIRVIARAAEVWITELGDDPAEGALQPRGTRTGSGLLKGAWLQRSNGWAVYPADRKAESVSAEPPPAATLIRHGTWWDRKKADRLD